MSVSHSNDRYIEFGDIDGMFRVENISGQVLHCHMLQKPGNYGRDIV